MIEPVNREYWFEFEGKQLPIEECMLAKLIDDDVLIAGCASYNSTGGLNVGKTITLCVNSSDVFAWGCADADDITLDELPELFKLHTANLEYGAWQWLCKKRNEQPQAPAVKLMKEAGCWTPELEALPVNRYDAFCKKLFADKAVKQAAVQDAQTGCCGGECGCTETTS